jgi:hypothetical protein
MNDEELKGIKARTEGVKQDLGRYSSMLELMGNDIPKLLAEIDKLREELWHAGTCPHGNFYEDRSCVECFGDGTEEMRECSACGAQVWHRGGKCVRHDASAPKPYEPLKAELQELHNQIQTMREQSSARVHAAEERLKAVEASRDAMREALEYVKIRIGSVNIGESLAKIGRALGNEPGGAVRGGAAPHAGSAASAEMAKQSKGAARAEAAPHASAGPNASGSREREPESEP